MASAFNPLTLASFNGTSQFAGDLQNVINHAVSVASIPLTQLGNNATDLQNQQKELSTLQSDFASLQTALTSLSAANSGSLAASISGTSVASVALDSSKALAGTYTVNVVNPGAQTVTLSDAGATVSDPTATSLSSAASFTLTINNTPTTITPASNTLSSLATAINGSGAGVTATIVNLGSPSSPDYRLSLQSTGLENDNIQLNDGSTDLLETLTPGFNATYQVNGQPSTPISSSNSTVTVAPGLSVQLLQAGSTTITVAPDSSAAVNALSALTSAYNNAVSDLAANHGTAGGALTGQPIVSQLEQALRGVLQYSGGSGSVQHLSDLGLTFDTTGALTFDQGTFESVQASNPTGVAAFLGSTSGSGTGFLGSANTTVNGLEDPITGLFQTTNANYQSQIDADTDLINSTEARITTMQATLVAQMSQADAALATLESQLTMVTGLFKAASDVSNANN